MASQSEIAIKNSYGGNGKWLNKPVISQINMCALKSYHIFSTCTDVDQHASAITIFSENYQDC